LWCSTGEAATDAGGAISAGEAEVKKEQVLDPPGNATATAAAEDQPPEEKQQQATQQGPTITATTVPEQARQLSEAAHSLLLQLPEYVDNIGFALTPIDLTTGMPVARSQLINTSCLAALQLLAGGIHASLHGRLAAAAAKV
jgi:hypothetical protein